MRAQFGPRFPNVALPVNETCIYRRFKWGRPIHDWLRNWWWPNSVLAPQRQNHWGQNFLHGWSVFQLDPMELCCLFVTTLWFSLALCPVCKFVVTHWFRRAPRQQDTPSEHCLMCCCTIFLRTTHNNASTACHLVLSDCGHWLPFLQQGMLTSETLFTHSRIGFKKKTHLHKKRWVMWQRIVKCLAGKISRKMMLSVFCQWWSRKNPIGGTPSADLLEYELVENPVLNHAKDSPDAVVVEKSLTGHKEMGKVFFSESNDSFSQSPVTLGFWQGDVFHSTGHLLPACEIHVTASEAN